MCGVESRMAADRDAFEHVLIPPQVHEAMIEHARFCYPEEACGLIAFDHAGSIRMAYATTNVDRSRVRFTVAPREHYGAIKHAERHGWMIAGSFHSHPESPAFPSGRDIEGALDPEWLYVIVGLSDVMPEVRAFRIRDYRVTEVSHREAS
jgi:proteasome lid subunit RPN8/RPN11